MSAAEPLPYPSRSRRVVIPGSLDQHYNEQGIVAFLDEAWPALRSLHVDLVIAGRNPRPALLAAARRAGVLVIENPLSMPNIVRDSLAVLVPDLGGAGMKLRVAEALGAGVPVVGTEAGLLGYEDVSSFGRTVSNIASMGEALREVLGSTQTGERLARGAREAWVCRYSFGAFSERLHGWLSSWGRGSP